MQDEILKIPEIPEIPQELIEAANEGSLLVFIGNGVSRVLGYPSWKELADKALNKIFSEKKISYIQFQNLINLPPKIKLSIFLSKSEGKAYDLKEFLKSSKKSRIYEYLAKIGRVFITTNYDQELETILRQQYEIENFFDAKSDFKKIDLSFFTSSKFLFYLHGSLKNTETMILSTKDYLQHYNNSEVITFLQKIFNKNVLFVGYGLEELEILDSIFQKIGKTNKINYYSLYPLDASQICIFNDLESYYKEHCNIKLIPFNIDEKGYEQLEDVLKYISEKIQVKPIPSIQTLNKIDKLIKENKINELLDFL